MKREHWERVHPLIVDCSVGLFDAFGVSVGYVGEVQRALVKEEGIAAFIGFAGENIRGTLVVSASFGLLGKIRPIVMGERTPSFSEDDLRDLTGELANQLLGRLKLRLSHYGVCFSLSTPTSLVGRDLRGVNGDRDGAHFVCFRCEDSEIYVQFDALTTPEFTLMELPQTVTPTVSEGDLMLF